MGYYSNDYAEDVLPPEFADLKGKVEFVRRRGRDEYSSSCPYKCGPDNGGQVHEDGTFPDRFRMLTNARGKNPVVGWCRNCNKMWFPTGNNLSPGEYAKWLAQREARELEELEVATKSLEFLRERQAWVEYHNNADEMVRELFYARNIDDEWIDYYELGYTPKLNVHLGNEKLTVGAVTIPLFAPKSRELQNIKYRLVSQVPNLPKYRYGVRHLPAPLFYANLDKYPSGEVVLVEGEFKAIRTYTEIGEPDLDVVGMPGSSPDPDLLSLPDCDRVVVIMDPDTYDGKDPRINRVVEAVGKDRSFIVDLPGKVDDLLDEGSLDGRTLRKLIKEARSCK